MSMVSSIVVGYKSTGLHTKPYPRFQALSWNPISNFAISKSKDDQMSLWGNKTRVQCDNKAKRNSFAIYASVPGAPLPSGPPSSNSIRSWILGMVVSLILPFFTNKWGPLWVIKNRIENAVQTVENIAEAVEKVAEGVDKMVEDIADDLPEGKLKNLLESVEHMAEKTAKTADSLDNIIDKVQEAEEQMEDIVEGIAKDAQSSPKEANDH